jgi:hypothetical protein
MSTRLSTRLRARTATITLAAGVLLIGTGGIATADPPSLNVDECAATLGAAGVWPGTIDDGDHGIRVVSDGFDSYLSRQPECAPDRTVR